MKGPRPADWLILVGCAVVFCTDWLDAVNAPKLVCLLIGLALLCWSAPLREIGWCARLYALFSCSWLLSALLGSTFTGLELVVVRVALLALCLLWARSWRPMDLPLLVGWGFNAGYSWLQRLGLDPVAWSHPHLSQVRTIGSFGNPNYLAFFLSSLSFLVHSRVFRPVWALGVLAMILTTTRGAWLGFACGCLVWLWFDRGFWRSLALVLALVCAAALFQHLRPGDPAFSVAGRAHVRVDESGATRLMLWESAALAAWEKPLLGWGPGHFGYQALLHREKEPVNLRILQRVAENPHNQYLYLWVQSGTVGLLLYLTLCCRVVWVFWRTRAVAPSAALVCVLVNQFFLCPTLPLEIVFVLLVAQADQEEPSGPPLAWLSRALRFSVLGLVFAVQIAVAQHFLGRADSGVAEYQRVLAWGPWWTRGSASYRLANLYHELGRHDLALSCLERWARSESEDPYVWAGLARELEHLSERDAALYGRAVSSWQEAIRRDPRNPVFLYQLSMLLWRGGNNEAALQSIDRSLAVFPGALAYYHRARVLHSLGRVGEAEASWREAGRLEPELGREAPWK